MPANAFPENTSPTFGAQSEAKNRIYTQQLKYVRIKLKKETTRPLRRIEKISRRCRLNHHLRGQGTATHWFGETLSHRDILENIGLTLRPIIDSIDTGTVCVNRSVPAHGGIDRLHARFPMTEIILSILEDLASQGLMVIRLACIARNDGSVVNVVEQATSMASQNGLLLGALNNGRQVDIIGLLQLLTSLQMV